MRQGLNAMTICAPERFSSPITIPLYTFYKVKYDFFYHHYSLQVSAHTRLQNHVQTPSMLTLCTSQLTKCPPLLLT